MTKLRISLDSKVDRPPMLYLGLSSDISYESLSRRRHRPHVKPHLTKEEWEAKKAAMENKEEPAEAPPAAAKKKSVIVHKNNEEKIKQLEADGYKLTGPVQGSSHLLYELSDEKAEEPVAEESPEEPEQEPVEEDQADDTGDEPEEEADEEAEPPDWWHKLNHEEQEAYLEDHPHSTLEITAPKEDDAPEHPEWWNNLTRDEQRDYIKKNPKDGFKLTAPREEGDTTEDDPRNLPEMKSIKKVANKMWAKRRAKVAATLQHHKTGLRSMRTLIKGGEVSTDDWVQAKKTAALTAKLVFGSLFVIGLFAGLAPFAAVAGMMFLGDAKAGMLNEFSGINMSSETDDTDYNAMALEVADTFYAWLTNQDVPALIEKLKAEKQDD